MKQTYPIVLSVQEGGYFLVTAPDVPTCVTGGQTLEEAFRMAEDALSGCLAVLEDEGVPLPVPTPARDVKTPRGGFVMLVSVDTFAWRMKTDRRAVRKNVSLPAWMDAMAQRRGLKYSKVLQDALRAMMD